MAVTEVPQFDPEHPKMISQGPSVCIFNKKDPQEVLASWLFAQFLLTDGVQIAYSETEGYVPVTSKAQLTPEYQDYLSRSGEDTEDHYEAKIQAAQLLLDNVENSFVTPVFNGSASLRSAASQLVEDVTKSVRRKQTIDRTYIEGKLYDDVTALYRLDQLGSSYSGQKEELGPLPTESKVLIGMLIGVWILLAFFFVKEHMKKSAK